LKSLWRSNEGRHIQEAGFTASLAGEGGRYGSGKAAGEDGQEERESQMSKGEKEEQFHE